MQLFSTTIQYPFPKLPDPSHLDGIGIILWAANHSGGPVEASRGLEGDCEVVGLRDVLHGGGAGVRLHDGGKLEGQHKREQLLQCGGTSGEESEMTVRELSHFYERGVADTLWWPLKCCSCVKLDCPSLGCHCRNTEIKCVVPDVLKS